MFTDPILRLDIIRLWPTTSRERLRATYVRRVSESKEVKNQPLKQLSRSKKVDTAEETVGAGRESFETDDERQVDDEQPSDRSAAA